MIRDPEEIMGGGACNFIRNLLFCGSCYSSAPATITHHVPDDDHIPANHQPITTDPNSLLHRQLIIIPAETTVDSLDSLINYLENLSKGSYAQQLDWKKYTENIPGFLESLAASSKHEVNMSMGVISKDTMLPLLGKVLGEIGSLHWAAFGLSMLAWGIETWDKQNQNFDACRSILKDIIDLLKLTRHLWEQDQSIISSNELMQSTLPAIAEVAFRASAIFASCSTAHSSFEIRRCVEILGTYIAAASLEESISAVKADIMKLLVKNELIIQQQMDKKLVTIQEQTRPRNILLTSQFSKLHTLEEEPLLGRQKVADEVEGILKKDFGKEIVTVCIHGMGGVGKSTLGLHIYNNLLTQFAVHSRVELDLDTKKTDLPRFQKQILAQIISKEVCINGIGNARDGREMLLRAFKGKHMPILLYIDNVDDLRLLPELLPSLRHLPEGSRLLVTTRNENASGVVKFNLNVASCHSIELKVLDADASRSLLREKALKMMEKKDIIDSNQTLKELEEEVLRLCGGLPLALKVMGSFISTWKNKNNLPDTWRYVIKAMKEARPVTGDDEDELYASLRVSIDALDDHLRRILLDLVMCQLYDYLSKDRLESIFGVDDLRHLIDRHLLEDVGAHIGPQVFGRDVRCHDVIESLVKSMTSSSGKQHLYLIGDESGDCPHLVKHIDSNDVANIVCLMGVELRDFHQLSKMKQLRYAFIILSRDNGFCDQIHTINDLQDLKALILVKHSRSPKHPVIMLRDCHELRMLSINFDHDLVLDNSNSCTKLEYLHLFSSEGECIDAIFQLTSLRHLHLENCKNLEVLPEGISNLLRLTNLSLEFCRALKRIHESIWRLPCLENLNLSECNSLKSLPDVTFQNVSSNLARLDLGRCAKLEVLPEGISKLTALKYLSLEFCTSLKSIPQSTWNLKCLEYFNLRVCTSLQAIPDVTFENVSSNLATLDLRRCEKLELLPEGISKLTALKHLYLNNCTSLKSIPEPIWTCPRLEVFYKFDSLASLLPKVIQPILIHSNQTSFLDNLKGANMSDKIDDEQFE